MCQDLIKINSTRSHTLPTFLSENAKITQFRIEFGFSANRSVTKPYLRWSVLCFIVKYFCSFVTHGRTDTMCENNDHL